MYTRIPDVRMTKNTQDKLDTEKGKHIGHKKVGVKEEEEWLLCCIKGNKNSNCLKSYYITSCSIFPFPQYRKIY